ncbi:MAG: hypothetical protein PHR06_12105 [Candidatus Cloacimonetes bacterium]|nr:hypothetical protein [Candidatus Cloacimonadota bacterium]
MKSLRIIQFLAIVLAVGCTNLKLKMFEKFRGGIPVDIKEPYELDFAITGSHIINTVVSFNEKNIPVVFDTGGITILDKNVADSMKLDIKNTPQKGAWFAKVEKIEWSEILVKDFNVSVMNFAETFKTSHTPLRGMIGSDFIRFYKTTIDYKSNKIIFSNPRRKIDKKIGQQELNMKIVLPYLPAVEFVADDIKVKGIIDTGLNYAFVFPITLAEKMTKENYNKMIPANGFFAKWPFTSQQRNFLYVFDSVTIGTMKFEKVPVIFADLPEMFSGSTALIGKYFLENYLTSLDFHNRKVVLEEVSKSQRSIQFSVGMNIVRREDHFEVTGVWQDSPADEAGFRPGLIISHVNNFNVEELTDSELNDIILNANTKSISFKYKLENDCVEVMLNKRNLYEGKDI